MNQKTSHILAPNQWNVFAKFLPIQLCQAMSVAVFFDRHLVEQFGRGWKSLPQGIRKIAVNVTVLLFGRDGQGQNLRLAQITEFHA